MEEVAPGVVLPFIHRPLSRYVNALVAAETMTGANGVTVDALPHDALRELLKKYGR